MGRFTNKQLGCQPLYTISYKQYVAVFKTWNDIPWKTSQLILDSQFMEVSSSVKHRHQQGSPWSSHGEPRDVLQSAVTTNLSATAVKFQKSCTNRIQTEQSSHWVSCKRYCSQREREYTPFINELILLSGSFQSQCGRNYSKGNWYPALQLLIDASRISRLARSKSAFGWALPVSLMISQALCIRSIVQNCLACLLCGRYTESKVA